MPLDGVAADDESSDEHVRAAQEDLAILEGARLALVGVDGEVLGEARLLADEGPLHAGGKPGSATPAQARLHHLVDDLLRLHLERLGKRGVAARSLVGGEREAVLFVPVDGEDADRAGHHFSSVEPASAAVVDASGPVACGSLCFSRMGIVRRGSGAFAISWPGRSPNSRMRRLTK